MKRDKERQREPKRDKERQKKQDLLGQVSRLRKRE
jgi:hypothetical protein